MERVDGHQGCVYVDVSLGLYRIVGITVVVNRSQSGMDFSSATIRNEMADLEEQGYIIQPHTSAGRIPSDKGYRFYVDQLIHEKETEVTQVRDMVIQRVDRVELLLKQMAKLLASNTNYATLISGPQYHQTKIKFIQLSRVEAGKLLIVTVLEGNIIKNSIVTLDAELTDEDILNLNILLNSGLNGLTMEQINLDVITRIIYDAHRAIVDNPVNIVGKRPTGN